MIASQSRRGGHGLRVRMALVLLAACAFVLPVRAARAADYILGKEDVVSVSVWLHPELERACPIDANGEVMVPPVGSLKAEGLTPAQLADRIADRLTSYLRQSTTVTVTVTQYLSRSVFLSGAVAKPGRYGFERIPSLLDVLTQAGGLLPNADLSHVQITRRDGEQRRIVMADLTNAVRAGDQTGVPELTPGDQVAIGTTGLSGTPSQSVAVLGEVMRPGLYTLEEGQDIWGALALAGGLTAHGRLADVRLLTRAGDGQKVRLVDLKRALAEGSSARVSVKAGDVIVVMAQPTSVWNQLVNVFSLSRDALNIVILLDYLNNKGTGSR